MKNVLVLLPFDNIYPPRNGGMLRSFNLLNQLCIYFRVTALMNQDVSSFRKAGLFFPEISNCNIFSTKDNERENDIFSYLPEKIGNALKYRYLNKSFEGPTLSAFLKMYVQLKRLIISQEFDYVIFEEMSIIKLGKIIRYYQPNTIIIYDAHNVNTILAEKINDSNDYNRNSLKNTQKTEESIYKFVDKIFACSEHDLNKLCEMNSGMVSGIVVPNGVSIPNHAELEDNSKNNNLYDIIFCGSLDYFSNREGLFWFVNKVLPLVSNQIPNVRLIVIGSGDPGDELNTTFEKKNVLNFGLVDDVSDYYQRVKLAIVPLLSGSGTRLKLLEAMSHKIPVVSTTVGAEGINYIHGKNIIIANDVYEFAQGIVQLFTKVDISEAVVNEAFILVQSEYDWNVIGKRMATYLTEHTR